MSTPPSPGVTLVHSSLPHQELPFSTPPSPGVTLVHSSLPRGYRQALLFDLLELLCCLAMRHVGAMQPQEVAGVLWAAASLDYPLEDDLMEALIQVGGGKGSGGNIQA